MGELEMFFPDRSGVRIPRDGDAEHYIWSFCDMCNKPQDQADMKVITESMWICGECRTKGYR